MLIYASAVAPVQQFALLKQLAKNKTLRTKRKGMPKANILRGSPFFLRKRNLKKEKTFRNKLYYFILFVFFIAVFCFLFSILIVTPLWIFATKFPKLFSLVFFVLFLFLLVYGIVKNVQKKS